MGVQSSNFQHNSRSREPPPLPPPFYSPGGYISSTSRTSEASDDPRQSLQTQQPLSGVRNLKPDEWRQQSRPRASSNEQAHETLLTYAAQMTGWQGESPPSAPIIPHQDTMDLTRTVSHLAAANQQLAGAHTALLAQLERLYIQLTKERESRRSPESPGRRRGSEENLKSRLDAIEAVLEGKGTNEALNRHKSSSALKADDEVLRREYQKAVERIQLLENELKVPETRRNIAEPAEDTRWPTKNYSVPSDSEDRVGDLLRQLARLQNDQLESQEANRRLADEVDRQKILAENIQRDYQASRNYGEKVKSRLNERQDQLATLTRTFEVAQVETLRLTKQLDAFQLEKDSAAAQITALERELAKAKQSREKSVNLASQEEITTRDRQTEALDESLREIQRLNDIIDTVKKEEKCEEPVLSIGTSTEDVSTGKSSLEEFKKDLSIKREARQRAIAAVSSEMERLRRELDAEKEAHSETSRILDLLKTQAEDTSRKSETFSVGTTTASVEDFCSQNEWIQPDAVQLDVQRLTDVLKVSDELRAGIRVQLEKIDDLRYHLECDAKNNVHRITILEDIASTNRQAFTSRESEINRLKNLLSQMIARMSDEKFRIDITNDLRSEHERHVEDIRRLKNLYNERMRILVEIKESAGKELIVTKDKLKIVTQEKEILDEEIKKTEEKVDVQNTEISNLESQLGLTKADCRDLQNQMSVINGLFSQMLLSASSADMDLDRLTQLLQENHDLISEMAREEGTEAAALPKLLLDLVEQVEGREKPKLPDTDPEKKDEAPQEENIANNLPKVWAVLLELLSCHDVGSTALPQSSLSTDPNSCYKSVDTPTGPRLVISVSKTYIRLKDLILEKKSLEKEMGRMKQLNLHLESKLGEQEKRLSTVSDELSKTWSIVGRMQEQHQQLHTHEKILRYELQQKRKMLQELKQELEYCREKWESARQKNTNTEMEWRNLRREFAARKALAVQDSFNNSAESGFSDERGDDSDDEDIPTESERLRVGPRRRTRKENPRAPTPDTESEQPTDTELSESKTGSTSTPERRTPTPVRMFSEESSASTVATSEEPMNSVDQALANVIQNLIKIDEEEEQTEKALLEPSRSTEVLEDAGIERNSEESLEKPGETSEDIQRCTENTIHDAENPVNTFSVFSIGPLPSIPPKSVQFSDPLVTEPHSPIAGATADAEKPGTSHQSKSERSPEEVLAARAARLKRLEEQADWLMKKMNATNQRGSALSTRLEELHEVYGDAPAPPPMPDVLPSVRLPTNAVNQSEDSISAVEEKKPHDSSF